MKYLANGGGLIIIHFANGAFHFSLPEAGDSDWPEYRKICRRVWDHTPNKSGHDAYGKFIVEIAAPDHPITQGMEPFETIDELYFRQQGEEPIEILATAKSNVTGRDEPMAFVYQYGTGRVMQTVLGHAAESLRTPGVVELIRRSAAWVAGRDQTLASSPPQKTSANKKSPSQNAYYHWSRDIVGFDWAEQDSVDNRWNQSDVGPFLASIVPMPGQPPVAKGLSIRVGGKEQASVCYDTQTMGLRSAWTGGFLKFDPARYGLIAPPQMAGDVQFVSSPDAGWVAKSVKYLGMESPTHVKLHALVDGVHVSESPGYLVTEDNLPFFVRSIEIQDKHPGLRLRIGRFAEPPQLLKLGGWQAASWKLGRTMTAVVSNSEKLHWETQNNDLQLVSSASDGSQGLEILFFCAEKWTPERIAELAPDHLTGITLTARRGSSWDRGITNFVEVTTQGTLGKESGPYQVDTLTIPFDNPAKALFFITGHDFFRNGDIAVCTVHGDVWRVSGVDKNLQELTWQRYATGLFQPLGLKIVDDVIHVLGRDRITKLHDDNGDGSADRYENFCDLYETSPGGHDYITCLETDADGNFYFVHAKHGVQRISKDGKKLETIATGLRNPNGLSISPTGEITAAPQEGEWTPASAIFMVRKGDHFGYGGPKVTPQRPLVTIRRCAGFRGLSTTRVPGSAGRRTIPGACRPVRCCICRSVNAAVAALREQVDGLWQGGVVTLPMNFLSGLNRALQSA